MDVEFKHKGNTDEVQGVVFTMNNYRFNGSKVDRQFSYSKIDAALSNNYEEERHSMVSSNPELMISTESSGGNLINGSLGLFTPNNVPEEQ